MFIEQWKIPYMDTNKSIDYNSIPLDLRIAIGVLLLLSLLFVAGTINEGYKFYGIFIGFLLITVLAITSSIGVIQSKLEKEQNEFTEKIYTYRILVAVFAWLFFILICLLFYIVKTTGFWKLLKVIYIRFMIFD